MTVWVVGRGVPSAQEPLAGIFEMGQARALQAQGLRIVYLVPDIRSIRHWRKWGYEDKTADGMEAHRFSIPVGRFPQRIKRRAYKMALASLYRRCLQKYGMPDIVHAHFLNQACAAADLKSLCPAPLVVTEHFSLMMRETLPESIKESARQAYNTADRVFAVSSVLKEHICRYCDQEVSVMPNMINDSIFYYDKDKVTHDGKFRFVFVGSLIPGKNIVATVEAFCETFSEDRDVVFYVIGKGPLAEEVNSVIRRRGVSEQVILLGQKSPQEIADIYRSCDAFVLASRYETFGVVYAEAMMCGLPVIATRCGGPEEFVNEANGILIPVDDNDALRNAFRVMRGSAGCYNRPRISSEAANLFSSRTVAKRLCSIYEELLDR